MSDVASSYESVRFFFYRKVEKPIDFNCTFRSPGGSIQQQSNGFEPRTSARETSA